MEGRAQPNTWASSASTSTSCLTDSARFSVSGIRKDKTTYLYLQGELDVAGAPVLLEYLQLTNAGLPEDICLDLSGLDFVDSTGLSLLVTMHKRARADGTRFTICAPSQPFLKLLKLTGLAYFFDFDGR